MLIYLDNCCYNRPYDDQSYVRISLETQAKLYIQHLIMNDKVQLASSYVLMAENDANPHMTRKNAIRSFIESYTTIFVSIKHDRKIQELSKPIIETGIKHADAYHIACAILAKCDYFITTDKRVLKYSSSNIVIQNPMAFLAEIEE